MFTITRLRRAALLAGALVVLCTSLASQAAASVDPNPPNQGADCFGELIPLDVVVRHVPPGGAIFYGTAGPDLIIGTDGDDVIDGLGGSDTICGGDGWDWIDGGPDGNWIDGGGGQDSLYGDTGADTIHGGPGADLIVGEAGNDTLLGQGGNDELWCGPNTDYADGGAGTGDSFLASDPDCEAYVNVEFWQAV